MKLLFEYKTHFEYIKEKLDPRRSRRGSKTLFAEHLRIQPAFLSQVIAKKHALNPEQADLANQFFEHSIEESHFFILLVSKDRAGTVSLKRYYDEQLQNILQKRQLISERLGKKVEISEEDRLIYYSSWLYSAIHVGCTIPSLQTQKEIASHFHISQNQVGKILDFLEKSRLIKKENDRYVPTQNWVRLESNSVHLSRHHINWRNKSIQSLDNPNTLNLRYSGVYSLDRKTFLKIKESFLEFIKQQVKEIETAPEEELVVLTLDFFQMTNQMND